MVVLLTLKRRGEFLRLRGGTRWHTPAFLIETKPRPDSEKHISAPRFGFTVTKAMGPAVVRNRIRRRLKAAVSAVAPANAQAGHDYVIVARSPALDRDFADIKKDLEQAFQRVHHPGGRRGRGQT